MQEQNCQNCNTKFQEYASNHRKYCSRACAYRTFEVNHTHVCEECGDTFVDKKTSSVFCNLSCSGKRNARLIKNHRGGASLDRHWNWKGGGTVIKSGYREIPLGKKNKKILEHRLVMEQHLGRKLGTKEHVHHINGNKLDNRVENLIVLDPSEHQRVHNQRRWHGTIAFV